MTPRRSEEPTEVLSGRFEVVLAARCPDHRAHRAEGDDRHRPGGWFRNSRHLLAHQPRQTLQTFTEIHRRGGH